jgi:hypothetical protein
MHEQVDWSLATWEGNRRRQHQDFLALSFREKLRIIEQLGEVADAFAERRRARGLPVSDRVRKDP